MNVVLYKAGGKDGYLYDISFNPYIDCEILKNTRNIKHIEVITPEMALEDGEYILKSIYGTPTIIGKLVPSQDYIINNILKKLNVKRTKKQISHGVKTPSGDELSRVEELIIGRIISLERIVESSRALNMSSEKMMDIVQALYCERRVRIIPAQRRVRNRHVCSICNREPCTTSTCCLGFASDDILLYAADNYSINKPVNVVFKSRKTSDIIKAARDEFLNFIKSKKSIGTLWCVPNSFEYDAVLDGIAEVVRMGGKVLYATSASLIYEAKETISNSIGGASVDITYGFNPNYKSTNICICPYNEYPCFYKAFDLVILDQRYSFVERPVLNISFMFQRAVKERGKFLNITCCPERERRGMFKSAPELMTIPVTYTKNPIPEPRIITSRFLKGAEAFFPQIVMDVIKWSLGEGSRVIIFVPDEGGLHKVYYYLLNMEGIDKDMMDISDGNEKSSIIRFKKRDVQILLSMDFKDAAHIIEDVNVIVMYGDEEAYNVDTLINMASMASMHTEKNLREVMFVASQESETLSLAKSTIRGINKIAWEKGYIKR